MEFDFMKQIGKVIDDLQIDFNDIKSMQDIVEIGEKVSIHMNSGLDEQTVINNYKAMNVTAMQLETSMAENFRNVMKSQVQYFQGKINEHELTKTMVQFFALLQTSARGLYILEKYDMISDHELMNPFLCDLIGRKHQPMSYPPFPFPNFENKENG